MAEGMYQITNYNELYRPYNKSGEELKRPDFVKLPINPKGDGLQSLFEHKRGLEFFGVWCLLLEKATSEKKPKNRGKLLNHQGQPASVAEIAKSISLKNKINLVEHALSILVSMGWVEYSGSTEQSSVPVPKLGAQVKVKVKVKEYMSIFDQARKEFYGTKRGLQTEFDNFCKKHKDWKEILPLLLPAIKYQITNREQTKLKQEFVPPPKNFKTWINNRCWEETAPEQPKKQKSLCACGCGKEAHLRVVSQWFYSPECRKKVLGW